MGNIDPATKISRRNNDRNNFIERGLSAKADNSSARKNRKHMKILITGDRGFVGTETIKVFEKAEIEVVGCDVLDGRDIRDLNSLDIYISEEKPDRILHLAAIARFSEADKNPILAFDTNALGTKNVVFLSHKYRIPLVYSSTGSVYMPIQEEPPITEDFSASGNSVYGCTKYVGEQYVKSSPSPWIILRYAHLYGAEKRHHGLIGGFLDRIDRGLAPKLFGGKQSNDFIYIKDVAQANLKACQAPFDAWNQIYNIGTGEELSAEAAGKIILKQTKSKQKPKIVKQRTVDPLRFVYDVSKADHMLGFKAEYKFKEGLEDMFLELKNKEMIDESSSTKEPGGEDSPPGPK